MEYTRSLATNFAKSCGERVARTSINACANVLAPPQTVTHSGLGSLRSAALISACAPAEDFPGPAAAIPYAGWPALTSESSSAAVGQPEACLSRFALTSPYWRRSRALSRDG